MSGGKTLNFRRIGIAGGTRGRLELDRIGCWTVYLLSVDRYLIVGNCLSVNSRHLSVLIGIYIIVGQSSSVMLGRYLEFDNLLSVVCRLLSVMFAEGLWVGWIDIWSAGWLLVGRCFIIGKLLSVMLGIVGWFAGESDGGGIGSAVFKSDISAGL